MKKTVAIINAGGNSGSAIALGLAKAGYPLLLSHYDKEGHSSLSGKFLLLVEKIQFDEPNADVQFIPSLKEACWEADIIIPSIAYNDQAAMASEIKDVVTGKIVLSIINPMNDSFDSLLIPPTTSAAEELATLLPNSNVVKAFNTMLAMDYETMQFSQQSIDVLVAGDDDDAVSTVAQLVRDIGLLPLYAGKLSASRTLESMMLLLADLSVRNKNNSLVGWKVVHRSL